MAPRVGCLLEDVDGNCGPMGGEAADRTQAMAMPEGRNERLASACQPAERALR